MSSKNSQDSASDGMSRKERRAADREARKGGASSSASGSPSTSSGPSVLIISIGALLIGLVAVAALVLLGGGLGGDDAAAVAKPELPPPALALRVGRSLGDPDAPVKIDAYEDPQCPACGQFTERIEPLLVAGPVKDGTVFFTYHDFAFIGPESLDAAAAMRVAEEMDGKFWDYHQLVFHNQEGENRGAFALDRLADMAELVGLDRDRFLAEMENPKYSDAVAAETAVGQKLGVTSTPSLFIDGELSAGVPQWEELKAQIETAAEAQAQG